MPSRAPAVATLIGDVVRSRATPDRRGLHARLRAALTAVNDELAPTTPLRVTVGDEYQGAFADLGTALHAELRLRVRLAPEVDVRHGLGWGPVEVLEEEPRVEDGPGWWAAREALEAVEQAAAAAGTRTVRTAYRRAPAEPGSDPGPINAALLCRDQVVGSLSARSVRILAGLLAGEAQTAIAEREQVSASAVSQRVRADGLAVVVAAQELLEETE